MDNGKLKKAKTVEELIALAKESDLELTEEQARKLFDQLHPAAGELSDDDLENVAGGASGSKLLILARCSVCGTATDHIVTEENGTLKMECYPCSLRKKGYNPNTLADLYGRRD